MAAFSIPVRVYWEDTDAGGVVYYANYLKFLERARTEWLRAAGVDQSVLRVEDGVVLVVRSVHCDYLSPARLDDELTVQVAVAQVGAASLVIDQAIDCGRDGRRLIDARVTAACLDAASWRPRRFPPSLRAVIATELP